MGFRSKFTEFKHDMETCCLSKPVYAISISNHIYNYFLYLFILDPLFIYLFMCFIILKSKVLQVLYSCIPVASLVIGITYVYECPINRLIPIWLIVYGSVALFSAGCCSIWYSLWWIYDLLLLLLGHLKSLTRKKKKRLNSWFLRK